MSEFEETVIDASELEGAPSRGRESSSSGRRGGGRSRSRTRGGNGADEGMASGGAGTWGAEGAEGAEGDADDAAVDGADGAAEAMADGGEDDVPVFSHLSVQEQRAAAGRSKSEYRRVRVPPHRYTPLRQQWEALMAPVVEHLKLLIRFNPRARAVELKTGSATTDSSALQKGADYVTAFTLGFELQDAVALLRLDDLYIDSFEVRDVKLLQGDHISRAIGRVAGQRGKMKTAIENATRTRIVIANERVHLLGSVTNIKVARDAICDLIMGAPIGKVYNKMRSVAKRVNERF
jgi:RNA-binding protein PNO1